MTEHEPIRLIAPGLTPADQTQSIYHSVAERMRLDTPDTIILCWPASPYVCLGYHQVCDRVLDRAECRRLHLPVFRRQVGGGLTYLDSNQLFYQCIFHRTRVPPVSAAIFGQLLQAPVNTLRRLGLNAALDQVNEISVDGKRIAGTGGGQIGEAAVVVGNILLDFDYERMAQVWQCPSPSFRELALAGMQEHITTMQQLHVAVSVERLQQMLVEEFERALKRPLRPGDLDEGESDLSRTLSRDLQSEEYLNLHDDRVLERMQPLKIAGGVFVHADKAVIAGRPVGGVFRVCGDRIEDVRLDPPWQEFEAVLRGQHWEEWRTHLGAVWKQGMP